MYHVARQADIHFLRRLFASRHRTRVFVTLDRNHNLILGGILLEEILADKVVA